MTEEHKPGDTDRAPFDPEATQHVTKADRVANALGFARIELEPKATKLIPWMPSRIVSIRRLRARGDYAGVVVLQMGVEPHKEFNTGQEPVPLERLVEPDHDNVQLQFEQGICRVGQTFVMELRNTSDTKRVFWLRPIAFADHLDADEPWKQ